MDQTFPAQHFNPPIENKFSLNPLLIGVAVTVVILGIVAGYFTSKNTSSKPSTQTTLSSEVVNTDKIVGSNNTKIFSDVATGKIEKGGIKGEGTHHLIRPGGESQTVYLISSIVDLEQFVGKQVEINGQTLKGRYASWLMDVGRVKILE